MVFNKYFIVVFYLAMNLAGTAQINVCEIDSIMDATLSDFEDIVQDVKGVESLSNAHMTIWFSLGIVTHHNSGSFHPYIQLFDEETVNKWKEWWYSEDKDSNEFLIILLVAEKILYEGELHNDAYSDFVMSIEKAK